MNTKLMHAILSVGVLLFASAPLALADPIGIDISVGGAASFNTTTVEFGSAFATGNTLNGSPIPAGTPVIFTSGPLTYTPGGNITPAFLIASMGGVDFFVTSENATYSVSNGFNDLSIMGTGYFTEAGYADTPASFDLTAQEKVGATVGSLRGSFSASSSTVTPEPSSLILLGTGFLTTAGSLLRRRRTL